MMAVPPRVDAILQPGFPVSDHALTRRRLLTTGAAASAALVAGPRRTGAYQATPVAGLTDEERGWVERAERNDINGWIRLKIGGAPFAR